MYSVHVPIFHIRGGKLSFKHFTAATIGLSLKLSMLKGDCSKQKWLLL